MDAGTFHALREAYTANMVQAEPEAPADYISAVVASCLLRYAAAEADPGTYAYHPHPNSEAEARLYNAAWHVMKDAIVCPA